MAYIGNSPTNIQLGRKAVYEFTATAGQTVFSGIDDNGLTLDLLEGQDNNVFLNGSRLVLNDDYTISGDTLTLTSAAALSDILVITTTTEVAIAHGYSKAESDSRYINYDGDIVNGDLQIVGNIDASVITASNKLIASNKAAIGGDTSSFLSNATFSSLTLGDIAHLYTETTHQLTLMHNAYSADGTTWSYIEDGYAPLYLNDRTSGAHNFYVTDAGLANEQITYNLALKIDSATGNICIGKNASAHTYGGKLNIVGGAVGEETSVVIANNNTNQFIRLGVKADQAQIAFDDNDSFAIGRTTTSQTSGLTDEYLTILSNGNVGIAQTNPSFALDVNGDARATRLIAGSSATGVISDELISAQATLAGQDYIRGFNYNGFNNFMAGNLSDASAYFSAFNASEEQTFLHRSDGTPKTAMTGRVAVGYNPTAPMTTLDVVGGGGVERTDAVLSLYDNSATDADVGPAINFSFDWNGTGGYLGSGPYIKGYKENASTGDYGSGLRLATRRNGIGYAVPAMIIDSYQRVTMPYQPSFHASAANQAFTAVQTYYRLSFNANVYHNIGGHLNASTGVFTAPVAGTYQFNANLRFDAVSGTYHLVRPYYNGGSVTGVYWINQEGGSYDSVQCSWAFYMQAGDTMEIRVMEYSDTSWSIDPQSSFSGFLVG